MSASITLALGLLMLAAVFTRRSPQGEWNNDRRLARAGWKTSAGRLTGCGLRLDFTNAPPQSNATACFDGARPGFADRHKAWLTRETKH